MNTVETKSQDTLTYTSGKTTYTVVRDKDVIRVWRENAWGQGTSTLTYSDEMWAHFLRLHARNDV